MNRRELKPCPFCGSKAELHSTPIKEIISCELCPCEMRYEGSRTALIAMWNTRTEREGSND